MPSSPPRICPDCQTPMQLFFAREVELDRCPGCGGIWFDWGELSLVTGRKLEPEPLGGHTERRCAYCRITLAAAVLAGGIPVETCTACRGIYLDAEELTELGGDEPEVPDPASARALAECRAKAAEVLRDFNTFACVKCGQRFPLREGHFLRGGLACVACTPQPSAHPNVHERDLLDSFIDEPSTLTSSVLRRWFWW